MQQLKTREKTRDTIAVKIDFPGFPKGRVSRLAEVKLPCEVGCELVAAVLGDRGPSDATAENGREKVVIL